MHRSPALLATLAAATTLALAAAGPASAADKIRDCELYGKKGEASILAIHQFRQTPQRGGIGARNWNSRRMRRRPRLKSEVRRRASFLGRASTGFFRRGADGRRRPTCRRTPPSAARAP